MSSQRRIESSRANGAKSHGPKTPEGRAISSRNAITHGLNADRIVLDVESPRKFEQLRDSYLRELAPANQIERDLVDQIVATRWRLERVWGMETALLDVEIQRQEDDIIRDFEAIDTDTRIALAFRALADSSKTLALLQRYEARFRHAIERDLETLRTLRSSVLPNEPNEPSVDAETSSTEAVLPNEPECPFTEPTQDHVLPNEPNEPAHPPAEDKVVPLFPEKDFGFAGPTFG